MPRVKTTRVETTPREGLGDKSYLPWGSGDFPRIALGMGVGASAGIDEPSPAWKQQGNRKFDCRT
jgi:hypothetical protein